MFRRRARSDRPSTDPAIGAPARGDGDGEVAEGWRTDVQRSLALLSDRDVWARERIGEVIAAIETAADDRQRVAAALERLDVEHTTRQLKVALREANARPSALADDDVARWRERYATVHRLTDRMEELDVRIAKAVRDIDAFAVRVVELAVDTDLRHPVDIDPLADDLQALEAAHDELHRLGIT
jgi:hypothetical protein